MDLKEVINKLKSLSNPKNVKGMARFGINPKNTFGISIYELRKIAKVIGKDHALALKLWDSKIHEARILAGYIDDPEKVTEKQMDIWVSDFDSWDVCDQVISSLFDKTPYSYKKAFVWSRSNKEFIKRAGFVMVAALSVHDKTATDEKLMKFFPVIMRGSTDERNFVKKAVNWALRQIGKRNNNLKIKAIQVAKEIQKTENKAAKWIANDALRELSKR